MPSPPRPAPSALRLAAAAPRGPVARAALPLLAGILLALGGGAAPALARDGDDGDRDEARGSASCGGGGAAELRLEADDGAIEVELRVERVRPRQRWRVVLVHERRVAWRGSAGSRSGGAFRIRRTLADYAGADQVTAIASGPGGAGCRASATLSGS